MTAVALLLASGLAAAPLLTAAAPLIIAPGIAAIAALATGLWRMSAGLIALALVLLGGELTLLLRHDVAFDFGAALLGGALLLLAECSFAALDERRSPAGDVQIVRRQAILALGLAVLGTGTAGLVLAASTPLAERMTATLLLGTVAFCGCIALLGTLVQVARRRER